ncbi:MAG: DinB family protein [Acidobacteriota bacterium]
MTPERDLTYRTALENHRRAVRDVLTVLESVPERRWGASLAKGKWTVAQLTEHLALSYEIALDGLTGGPGMKQVLPWWKTRFLRLTILRRILRGQGFPEGAPAPRELRPGMEPLNRDQGIERLRATAAEAESALESAPDSARVPHAYFGLLTAKQILGVQTAHLDHHRTQVEGFLWRSMLTS